MGRLPFPVFFDSSAGKTVRAGQSRLVSMLSQQCSTGKSLHFMKLYSYSVQIGAGILDANMSQHYLAVSDRPEDKPDHSST
jgi:hypothetical protein